MATPDGDLYILGGKLDAAVPSVELGWIKEHWKVSASHRILIAGSREREI